MELNLAVLGQVEALLTVSSLPAALNLAPKRFKIEIPDGALHIGSYRLLLRPPGHAQPVAAERRSRGGLVEIYVEDARWRLPLHAVHALLAGRRGLVERLRREGVEVMFYQAPPPTWVRVARPGRPGLTVKHARPGVIRVYPAASVAAPSGWTPRIGFEVHATDTAEAGWLAELLEDAARREGVSSPGGQGMAPAGALVWREAIVKAPEGGLMLETRPAEAAVLRPAAGRPVEARVSFGPWGVLVEPRGARVVPVPGQLVGILAGPAGYRLVYQATRGVDVGDLAAELLEAVLAEPPPRPGAPVEVKVGDARILVEPGSPAAPLYVGGLPRGGPGLLLPRVRRVEVNREGLRALARLAEALSLLVSE